ncbi:MAG TPA: SURF1 family protein [Anaerolineales bacterium]|nr:SURF1 family protein [Anaerolineales bacterium]
MTSSSTLRPTSSSRSARRWVFFALALVVGVVCVRLGIWQLGRLGERRAQNAAARARMDLPALILPEDITGLSDLSYRRASARGVFDSTREVYLSDRSLDGVAGVHVVTPLHLEESDQTILVERGWIADSVYRTQPPASWSVEGQVEVSGLLLPSQREPSLAFLADRPPGPGEPPRRAWRALSIPGIQAQLPYPVLGVYLMQESSGPSEGPLTPILELDLSEGSHLGYAVQWFAFAATAFIGGWIWMRRRPGGGN